MILNESLEEFLRKKYPDLEVRVKKDFLRSIIEIFLCKRINGEKKGAVNIKLSEEVFAEMPQIVDNKIEESIRKLREFVLEEERRKNNPSSRWFS